MSKSTLTFSCLLSSWCLCMKYWSLSCCLRSWCFSCRCRSSSSQNAASRAGRKRRVGSGIAIPSHTCQPTGVCSEVAYKCHLLIILFHRKCFYYCSRLVMKVFDFIKWRKTIILLNHQCLFEERAWCWVPLMSCCLLLRQSRSIVASSVFCCWIIFFRDASSSCCCFCTNSCSW